MIRLVLMRCVRCYQVLSGLIQVMVGLLGVRTHCKFPRTCSHFAIDELRENASVLNALQRIAKRILVCSPLFAFFDRGKDRSWISELS